MFTSLGGAARKLLFDIRRSFQRWNRQPLPAHEPVAVAPPVSYRPLQRLVLTDGVNRTLFEEYAEHRAHERGGDETGWVLLGLREEDQAVVLATLPAGARSDSSASHVQFNGTAQAMGSCMVRQTDRRLKMLGVVHTHPGSLRHPSDGDYQGDIQWVRQLRGKEGVFGIGTADVHQRDRALFAHQPRPNVQCLGELCLSWYSLRHGGVNYRPLPVSITLGPDLARPLHPVWPEIEEHAEQLERLYRQQSGVKFDLLDSDTKPGLAVTVPLAEPASAVRVVIRDSQCRYYVIRNNEVLQADCGAQNVDRGVYLLLAELASQAAEAEVH